MRLSPILLVLLASAACATAAPPPPAGDRILVVDSNGNSVRQSTADEYSRASFAAPVPRVWSAVMLAYADLGIEPSIIDRASGRYGNAGFVAPRRLLGKRLSEFFSCGSGLTGPLIETGRLYGNVVSTVSDDGKGGSVVSTHVSGSLSRNDGTSTSPINCGSTGAFEEYIRHSVETRLASS
jgi:hypothetical protein